MAEASPGTATETPAAQPGTTAFSVRLDEFEGPFDLLLSLIAKHRLDVTVLALHTVIDDFLAHIRARGPAWDLDEATEFLVVAATLLDLKAARLLPSGEVEDEEDLALLEARDILFARLLQYRAYKDVSAVLAELLRSGSRRHPREVGLDPQFSGLLPEVLIGLGPLEFAALAARALAPKPVPQVGVAHIHAVRVSVREQAAVLVDRLRRHPSATFRSLTSDCDTTLLVVARFLALLELYRDGSVAFDQVSPLGELHVRWTGAAEGEVAVRVEEYDGAPPDLAAEPADHGGSTAPEAGDAPAGPAADDMSDIRDIRVGQPPAGTTHDQTGHSPAGSTEEPR
ncbi:MAG TPA: segregation/condensation protein A [Propionibacteriaceae bacterium]|nr:segregation/condensation protein A [Propionibacteriaceae bacterium]